MEKLMNHIFCCLDYYILLHCFYFIHTDNFVRFDSASFWKISTKTTTTTTNRTTGWMRVNYQRHQNNLFTHQLFRRWLFIVRHKSMRNRFPTAPYHTTLHRTVPYCITRRKIHVYSWWHCRVVSTIVTFFVIIIIDIFILPTTARLECF